MTMNNAGRKAVFKKRYEIKSEYDATISTKVYAARDKQENNENVVLVVMDEEDDFSYQQFKGFKSLAAARENAWQLACMLTFNWVEKGR